MKYDKPHASLDEQIERLQKRGMLIKDVDAAKRALHLIGYFRLSSYWGQFEAPPVTGQATRDFCPGATFEDVMNVYEFDQALRLLLIEGIERLEIALRAVWSDAMAEAYGPYALTNREHFTDPNEYYDSYVKVIQQTTEARITMSDLRAYLEAHGNASAPPIWAASAVMSFGQLQRWVKNTKAVDVKKKVARAFNFPTIEAMNGTLRSLAIIRNKCAHFERLWDAELKTRMPLMKKGMLAPMVTVTRGGAVMADSHLYNYVLVLSHIIRSLSPNTTWPRRVATLVQSSLSQAQQRTMGFPEGWEAEPFWAAYLKG